MVAVLLLAGVLAGCSGVSTDAVPTPTTNASTTTEAAGVMATGDYPTAPENLTNATARAVALDSEAVYVRQRLRTAVDVRTFDVGNGTVEPGATVLNWSDGGVYVRVVQPYRYQVNGSHADLATEAVYFVSTDTVRREYGSDVMLP